MPDFTRPLLAVVTPLGLLSGQFGPTAHAQAPSSAVSADVQTVFAAAYFEVYAPRTALDMVNQVPGFSIRAGDLGKRGLGQGGANILINGERLTGKANPFDALEQILAANVVSIEIVDGASLSIPGLSGQVADITVEGSAFSGSWEWNPEFRDGLQPNWTNGRVNIAFELGKLEGSAFVRDFGFRGGADGFEERRDADGTLFERRTRNIDNYGDRPGVGANLTWRPHEDHIANLDAEYALFNFNRKDEAVREALTPDGSDLLTLSEGSEDETYLEIGADYQLPLLGGTFKAIGYIEREDSPTLSTFSIFNPVTGFTRASRFIQDADESETILRGEYGWIPSEGKSWEIGVEGAFNSLEVTQQFVTRGPGEAFSGDPAESFEVSEDRYEATLTHSRPLGPKWDIQASLGAEYSELSQMRDDRTMIEPREFVRPKGFVSASYKASDDFTIRTRVEREVGQLNFFDFVASVDLVDDLGRDGNPDLVPAQSWLGSVEFDRDFGEGNTLNIEVYGALIEDIVDRIPIGLDGDAVGNLDSAMRYGVDVEGTLKGERWGLPGTQFDYQLEWRDSDLDDPTTGISRRISGDKKIFWFMSLRHDIPKTDLAYGAFAERFISARRFRSFDISRNANDKALTGLYLEHKDIFGIKARVQLINPIGDAEIFERTVFDGRRDRGVVLREDAARFEFGEILQLRLSGEF